MLSREKVIVQYIHCAKCVKEIPEGVSPKDFQSVEVGFTVEGLQVWCKRHQINIVHIDFEKTKHPAVF